MKNRISVNDWHDVSAVDSRENTNKSGDAINLSGRVGDVAALLTVSDPELEKNLEEGIKDVVLSLIRFGYFPISSCEGHTDGDTVFLSDLTILANRVMLKKLIKMAITCNMQYTHKENLDRRDMYPDRLDLMYKVKLVFGDKNNQETEKKKQKFIELIPSIY